MTFLKKISGMCLLYYLNLNIAIGLSLELYEEIKNNFTKFECSLIFNKCLYLAFLKICWLLLVFYLPSWLNCTGRILFK